MIDTSKRISIRVSEQLFEELDDKRHAMRVSFQSLGTALFRSWLEFFPGARFGPAVSDSIRAQEPGARIPVEDSRPPVGLGTQGADVPTQIQPVVARFVEFWEHPTNAFERNLKALMAESVFENVTAAAPRKRGVL